MAIPVIIFTNQDGSEIGRMVGNDYNVDDMSKKIDEYLK
jgi:histidinol phosphatase-like enzyme